MRVRLVRVTSENAKEVMRVAVKDAIDMVENAGLSVYRRKRKERLFMKIYNEPLNDLLPKVSGNALKVFLALGNQLGWENTIVQLTRDEIEKATNLSPQTIRTSLNELEELGLITRIGANIRRQYVLNEMYIKRGK
ncbi:replication/maintenance protein RepL [uncultured Nostoc sp.]|uniref:replication/maintenance protein RepL n=1 Tax=uncultured Nostoc sp. TaxID=340711 RepID=UPI0035CAEFD3